MKKGGLVFQLGFATVLAVFLFASSWHSVASAEGVRFILNWVPDGQQTAWFAGREQGFYKEQGLDLTIIAGSGSAKAVKAVAGKAADYGLADMGEIIKGRATNIPIKATGVFLANDLNVIYTLTNTGIKKPKDLEGRTIGSPVWSSLRTVFPLLAKVNKVDIAKVKWVSMPPSAMAPSLYSGKVDSIATFTSVDHNMVDGAEKVGKKIQRIIFSDWGVNIYSLAFNTLDERIQKNPDQVRRFMSATIKSLAWTAKNPDKAVSVLLKSYPQATHKSERLKWQTAHNAMLTETTIQHGLGYITEKKMEFTRDAILSGLGKKQNIPAKDLYTNAFLPKRGK